MYVCMYVCMYVKREPGKLHSHAAEITRTSPDHMI